MSLVDIVSLLKELWVLVQVIEKANAEWQIERKLHEDVKAIHEAFAAKDSNKLNDIFNGKLRDEKTK